MSEQNVAMIRGVFDAFNRGELDESVAQMPDDFVADWSASISPDIGVYRGPEEIGRLLREVRSAWSEIEYFETEIIDRGDVVIRVGGIRATGKGSGAEVTARGAQVWRFDGDEPVSIRFHQNKEEALQDADSSE